MPISETSKALDESLVREIVRRVLSVASPEKIILFGSAATGTMSRDSDIDLLVIERNPQDRRRESIRIDEALSGLGYPFDVIVIASDWFEETKTVIGGIAYPANKYGRAIYEVAAARKKSGSFCKAPTSERGLTPLSWFQSVVPSVPTVRLGVWTFV